MTSTVVDRLRSDVHAIAGAADRPRGSVGHEAARRFLAGRVAELGLWPYPDATSTSAHGDVRNVLALVPGADRHRRLIVLATNYDTLPNARGAGKNAAAAALMLEAAAHLSDAGLERGVLLAFLDAGADPASDLRGGARAMLEGQLQHDVKAAVVLDRLGHAGPGPLANAVAVTGPETDTRLPALLDAVARDDLPLVHVDRRARRRTTPSRSFHAAAIPYLEFSCGVHETHDGPADAPDTVDHDRLARLTELVVDVVARLDTTRLPGPYEAREPVPDASVVAALDG